MQCANVRVLVATAEAMVLDVESKVLLSVFRGK